MEGIDVPALINAIVAIAAAAGFLALPVVVRYAVLFKKKIRAAGELLIELADDVEDNHLSEEEYRKIVQKGRTLLS